MEMETVFHLVQDVLNELRIDIQEVIGDIFEQIGIEDVWGRIERTSSQIRLIILPSPGQMGGSRRNIVRRIGTKMPFKPVHRPYLRLVKNVTGYPRVIQQTIPCSDDVAYVYTCPDEKDCSVGLNRCGTLLNETDFQLELSSTSTPKRPTQPCSSLINTSDANGANATTISNLQQELEQLRSQFAIFVAQHDVIPAPSVSRYLIPNECMNRQAPPPPPPLPATPLFISNVDRSNSTSQFKQSQPLSLNTCRNMIDVLKDMDKVKLKPVARSPGGNPLRRQPRFDRNDPAAIMSAALKKRFAHLESLQESLVDKENDNDSVWDCDTSCSSPMIKAY